MSATILVVDDSPDKFRLVEDYLTGAGHRVITVGDEAAATRMLSAEKCDLVLCDLTMPETDGYELCRAIKQAPATTNIPVVLVNAADDELAREKALNAGADDFAVRPLQNSMLLAIVKAHLRIGRLKDNLEGLESLVVTLARGLDDRDRNRSGHSERVAHWALQLGSAIGLPEVQLDLLYRAALLHNIGNLAVPRDILEKPGELDPAEISQVRRHPEMGEQLLVPLPSAESLRPAARHHHERVDGTGYPDGLKGEGIPLFARIIAIADAFVAMTNQRTFRKRLSRDDAMKVLADGAGSQWDPTLMKRFLDLLAQAETLARPELSSAGF